MSKYHYLANAYYERLCECEALLAQQAKALRALCDEADTCENCFQESKKARAVLAQEVPS